MKKIIFLSLTIAISFSYTNAFANIVIEGASGIWEKDLSYPTAAVDASQKVTARILVEYASTIYETEMAIPANLINISGGVAPRILVEYATTIFETDLVYPTALVTISEDVAPRIVVDYATTIWVKDLDYPFLAAVIAGDFNGIDGVTLADAILVLKVLCGMPVQVEIGAAVNNGDKCGLPDAVFVLQKVAQIRP